MTRMAANDSRLDAKALGLAVRCLDRGLGKVASAAARLGSIVKGALRGQATPAASDRRLELAAERWLDASLAWWAFEFLGQQHNPRPGTYVTRAAGEARRR